jgi:hypothetical protein
MLMKSNRFWIETLALGTAIACGCALLIAILAAAGAAITQSASAEVQQSANSSNLSAPDAGRSQTFEGMVTCSRCGAKHSAAIGKTAGDCTRVCVHGGAAFALIEGERTYTLEGDLAAIKQVAGERARVVGEIRGNTIQVASIVAI